MIVLLESIRAAVQAYGDGKITEKDIPTPSELAKKDFRYAPKFVKVGGGEPPSPPRPVYTSNTIGKFLGLNTSDGKASERLRIALDALELIEEGYIKESELKDFNITQLEDLVRKQQWNYETDKRDQAEAEVKQKQPIHR